MATLEALASKLEKHSFKVISIEHNFPYYSALSTELTLEGYTVYTSSRPCFSFPIGQRQLPMTPRDRERVYARALAPFARSLLEQDADVYIVNYPPNQDEGRGLAAALLVLFSQYEQKPRTLITPVVASDSDQLHLAVRIAHAVSFYCADLSRFLDAFHRVYSDPQDKIRTLYEKSVRILMDTKYDCETKEVELKTTLRHLAHCFEAYKQPQQLASISGVFAELTFRVDGLHSILYDAPLLSRA